MSVFLQGKKKRFRQRAMLAARARMRILFPQPGSRVLGRHFDDQFIKKPIACLLRPKVK